MKQALILAGGLGTRLRAVTGGSPKPLAPIRGKPFLWYLVEQLRRNGIDDVVLCVGYGGELIEEYFRTASTQDVRIRYSSEGDQLRGTAGAVRLALPLLEETFLAMNGDSFFDVPLADLVARHRAFDGASATLALAHVPAAGRYGSVDVQPSGAVAAFREKAASGGPGLINAGIYVVERATVEGLPDDRPVSLERDVFPSLIGHGLYGVPFEAFFVDMGVPDDYRRLESAPDALLAAG